MNDDKVQVLVPHAFLLGIGTRHRFLIQGMENRHALDVGMARDPGYVLHLVDHHRIGHERTRVGLPGNVVSEQGTEVGGVVSYRTVTDIVDHRLVHLIYARLDRFDESAPADHGIDVGEGHPRLLHGIEDDALTEIELVEHARKREQLFGRMAERDLTHGLIVLINGDLGRSRARIYR